MTTKAVSNQKPKNVYLNKQDIFYPQKRIGQYTRTGEIKPENTTNKNIYFFGEYIEKATLKRYIAIEESMNMTQPVYKSLPGCNTTPVGYFKSSTTQTLPIYLFNPSAINITALSKKIVLNMLQWAQGAN